MSDRPRERRLRLAAKRRGYRLDKSRRRDPQAADFGLFALIDAPTGKPVTPWNQRTNTPFGSTLDQIEAHLLKGQSPA